MSDFEKRNRRKANTSQVKFKKKFSVLENFLYQQERKVSRNLMLKANRGIGLSSIFVSVFGAKKRFSQWGNAVQIGDSTRCCNSLWIRTLCHCTGRCGKALRGRDKSEDLPERIENWELRIKKIKTGYTKRLHDYWILFLHFSIFNFQLLIY